ncbi:MAG: pyruvate kinase [Rhodospirillales bacterium]|nr:pyruvate kinase [Rhodospirillales bacterium]
MKRNRQTKIVGTLGPASSSKEMIRKLFVAGVDVFRLNFSHGTHADHKERIGFIREIEKEYGKPIGVIGDLQGPKLRVGKFKGGKIALTQGMTLRFDLDPAEGDDTRVNLPHPEVIAALNAGDRILLDDGKVRVKIIAKGADFLDGEVEAGVKLSNNKGFNVPGVILPIAALTAKDKIDLDAALEMGVDWIAQSFVQQPDDIILAKNLIESRAKLMIKLEKPSALDYLDEMIALADGVMLARGDLGVEIPPEQVPSVQKRVVKAVRYAGKPIVVATQMLESMIESPTPTRAEASDVATAVYDGTDAVMLSAETAAGSYPLEAVQIMERICQTTEADPLYRTIMEANHPESNDEVGDAITVAADRVARTVDAACITTFTSSGSTTLRAARHRPEMPILCLTPSEKVAHQMCVSYGVHPSYVEYVTTFKEAVAAGIKCAKEQKLAGKGDLLVITAGVPFGMPGTTNNLRVAEVE